MPHRLAASEAVGLHACLFVLPTSNSSLCFERVETVAALIRLGLPGPK